MNKNKKLLILINDLNFFCSHRLPIAEASKINGFNVVIGYGELGSADPKLLRQKGFEFILLPFNTLTTKHLHYEIKNFNGSKTNFGAFCFNLWT